MPALVDALTSFLTSLGLTSPDPATPGPATSGLGSRAAPGSPDAKDDPRPHVAGNSLGGAIALELAAAGHVASATALSPAGFASAGQLRYAVAVLTAHRLVSRLPTPLVRTVLRSPRLRAAAFGMLLSRPGGSPSNAPSPTPSPCGTAPRSGR